MVFRAWAGVTLGYVGGSSVIAGVGGGAGVGDDPSLATGRGGSAVRTGPQRGVQAASGEVNTRTPPGRVWESTALPAAGPRAPGSEPQGDTPAASCRLVTAAAGSSGLPGPVHEEPERGKRCWALGASGPGPGCRLSCGGRGGPGRRGCSGRRHEGSGPLLALNRGRRHHTAASSSSDETVSDASGAFWLKSYM